MFPGERSELVHQALGAGPSPSLETGTISPYLHQGSVISGEMRQGGLAVAGGSDVLCSPSSGDCADMTLAVPSIPSLLCWDVGMWHS